MKLIPAHSIRGRLLLSFSLLIAAIATFVFLFFPPRQERQALRELAARADGIRDMAAYSLSAGLLFGDSAAIDDVLSGASKGRDVRFLVVRDPAQKIVMVRGADSMVARDQFVMGEGVISGDGMLYVTSTEVRHQGTILGTLTVGLSLESLRREVRLSQQMGGLAGLMIFLVGFVVVFMISTEVTRPLGAVAETMNEIAAGNLSRRAAETSDEEVAALVRAFNRMVDTVATSQLQLSAANQMLEARVQDRTIALTSALEKQRSVQIALSASEADARAATKTMQSLIDLAPQAIVAVDNEWKVTLWNSAAVRLFGWTAAEVMGNRLPYLPPGEETGYLNDPSLADGSTALAGREAIRFRKDGSEISVLVSAGVLRDSRDAAVGYVAILTDLTERKQLEEQLRQSQKMEALGRLAGGVAHDFNNLLTVITSYCAMLLEKERPADEKDDLEQISSAARRASTLTRQLLTFSRKQIVQLQQVSLNEVVRGMTPLLQRLMRENIRWSALLDDELAEVSADPAQLEQVIMNLAVNASDAMPAGGTLALETRNVELGSGYLLEHPGITPGEYVRLTVADSGVGMDQPTLTRIFEPFFTTKEAGKGTGLGLATVYAIVSQVGGHIDVSSKPGEGTVFRVYLPASRRPLRNPPAAALSRDADTSAPARRVVLLVEDEAGIRRVLRRGLEKRGFDVIEAVDGESGLALAATCGSQIDILVTDLMMPGINGRDVATRLEQMQPGVRVVFMSGYADDTVSREGLTGGTHSFLQKPFDVAELVHVMTVETDAGIRQPSMT